MSRRYVTARRCAWPGCPVTARRDCLMCARHWTALPKRLRAPVWEHYVPGQDDLATATPEYREALAAALDYARRANADAGRQAALEAAMRSGQGALW